MSEETQKPRYIDANKLKQHYAWWGPDGIQGAYKKIFDQIVDAQPTTDVEEVRHGTWMTEEYIYDDINGDHWEERPAESYDYAYCSLCGGAAGLDGAENYNLTPRCPHCGAKMD